MASSTTPEQYSCFFESTVWDLKRSDNTAPLRETSETHTANVEEREEPKCTQADGDDKVSPQVELDDALNYLDKIKKRFQKHPAIYNQFLEILGNYQREKTSTEDVYAQVTRLFGSTAPDLVQGFEQFLPEHAKAAVLARAQQIHKVTVEEREEPKYTQPENAQTVDMVLEDKEHTDDEWATWGQWAPDDYWATDDQWPMPIHNQWPTDAKWDTVSQWPDDVQWATSIAQDESSWVEDDENDAWSVVSDGDETMIDDDQGPSSGDDEADDERDVDGVDDAAGANDEESLDNTLIDTEEEEHIDDCTEDSIRIRELQQQLKDCQEQAWEIECGLDNYYREELDDLNRKHKQEVDYLANALQDKEHQVDLYRTEVARRRLNHVTVSKELEKVKRQHMVEYNREGERADKAEEQLNATQKLLEDCRQDTCDRLCAAEEEHQDQLDEVQRQHDQELQELKREQRQTLEGILRAAEEDAERCRLKAVRDAELYAEAALVLSAEIERNKVMKAQLEEVKSRYEEAKSRYEEERTERDRLIKKAREVLSNSTKVNDENRSLKEQLENAVTEIQQLKQEEQTTKAGHEQEIARLKEEAHRQHEQACEQLVDEYEQDCTELTDFLWEAENEIDEPRQKEQEIESKHKQEMDQVKADRVWFQNKCRDLTDELHEVDELRKQLKEAKHEVERGKEREQELMLQQGADRAMFERSLFAMRNLLQSDE